MRSATRPPRCRRADLDGRSDQRAGAGLHGSAGRQGHRRRCGDMVLSLGRRIDGDHAEQRRRLDIGRKKPTLVHHQLHDGGRAREQGELRSPKRRTACCQPAMRLCLGGLHPALTGAWRAEIAYTRMMLKGPVCPRRNCQRQAPHQFINPLSVSAVCHCPLPADWKAAVCMVVGIFLWTPEELLGGIPHRRLLC